MDEQLSLFATQPQWVDAKASKPHTGKEVLAYVKYLYHGSGYGNGYEITYLLSNGGWSFGTDYAEVLYWMQIPELPEEV